MTKSWKRLRSDSTKRKIPMAETITACFLFGTMYLIGSWFMAMDLLHRMWCRPNSIFYQGITPPPQYAASDWVLCFLVVFLMWPVFYIVGCIRAFIMFDYKLRWRYFIGKFASLIQLWIADMESMKNVR